MFFDNFVGSFEELELGKGREGQQKGHYPPTAGLGKEMSWGGRDLGGMDGGWWL